MPTLHKTMALAGLLGLATALPSQAVVITNTGQQMGNPPGDTYQVDLFGADVGQSFGVTWFVPAGTGSLTHDLSAEMTITVLAFSASQLDLGVFINNSTDVSPDFMANVLSFGFGVRPDVTASYISQGIYFDGIDEGSGGQQTFPGGYKQIDVCVFASNNCSGGNVNNGMPGDNTSDNVQIRLTPTGNDFSDAGDVQASLLWFPLKFQTDEGSYEPAGTVVPVPAAAWLFGAGLLMLAARLRQARA